jgi:hypothetical protein
VTAPPKPASNLYERIHALFAALGGADDLVIPPREPGREPPRFDFEQSDDEDATAGCAEKTTKAE